MELKIWMALVVAMAVVGIVTLEGARDSKNKKDKSVLVGLFFAMGILSGMLSLSIMLKSDAAIGYGIVFLWVIAVKEAIRFANRCPKCKKNNWTSSGQDRMGREIRKCSCGKSQAYCPDGVWR